MQLRPTTGTEVVECDGCVACCRRELVFLQPFEVAAAYETEESVNPLTGRKERVLKHKPNGDCVYLGEGGCTIHDRRPAVCRGFSCLGMVRSLMERIPRQARRRMLKDGRLDPAVWEAGARRLEPSR